LEGIYCYQVFEQLDAYFKKEENLVSNIASLGATPGGRVTEVRTTWHDVIFCPCINRESVPESEARYAFLYPKDSGMAVAAG
jgi:hypothetical protein